MNKNKRLLVILLIVLVESLRCWPQRTDLITWCMSRLLNRLQERMSSRCRWAEQGWE